MARTTLRRHRGATAGPDQVPNHTDPLDVIRPRGARPGRRATAAAALLLIAAGAIAVASGALSNGHKTPTAGALSNSIATTTVTRRDLVQQDTENGTLGYGDSQTVVNRLAGTITWLPSAGTVVQPGGALFEIDAKPAILLDGSVPVYRALGASDSAGPDILELKRNLSSLGYDPAGAMTITNAWDSATTAAVNRLLAAHGLSQTGNLTLGRVVFLHGARRVGTLSATVGSTGGGGSGGGSSGSSGSASGAALPLPESSAVPLTPAVYRGPIAGAQFADYVVARPRQAAAPTPTISGAPPLSPTPPTQTPSQQGVKNAKQKKKKTAGAGSGGSTSAGRTPAAGGASTRRTPAAAASTAKSGSAASGAAAGGATSSPSTTIMTTTSTRQVVSVPIDTAKASVAHTGEHVTVQLPSGRNIPAQVSSVGKIAQSTSSSSSSGGGGGGASGGSSSATTATITVTVTLDRAQATTLDQAPVTVVFEQSRARNVLAVPVTALIATPGGGFALEVVSGQTRRQVPVTTGLFTSGYVEISGDVQPGEQVTNASE